MWNGAQREWTVRSAAEGYISEARKPGDNPSVLAAALFCVGRMLLGLKTTVADEQYFSPNDDAGLLEYQDGGLGNQIPTLRLRSSSEIAATTSSTVAIGPKIMPDIAS